MAIGYDWLIRAVRSNRATHAAAMKLQMLVPDRPVTRHVHRLGRFRFRLRRHRWMLGANPFGGEHELSMQTFKRLVRPGDVFYDIGANVGYYSRLILQELPVKNLVAFEPMSENLELLRANLTLGKFDDRSIVRPEALSDHEGEESLQIDDVMGGSAALSSVTGGEASTQRQRLGLESKAERVKVRRLDDLMKDLNLPPPNVMKIDVEGAEASVLAGATKTLLEYKPRLVIALHGDAPAASTLRTLTMLGATARGEVRGKSGEVKLTSADATNLSNNNILAAWNWEGL